MQLNAHLDTSKPGAFVIRNHAFNTAAPGAFTIRNHAFSPTTQVQAAAVARNPAANQTLAGR
jgi:hypothetical protein